MKPGRTWLVTICLLISAAALAAEEPWVEPLESPYYFAVSVADMNRAVSWYQSVFGLQVLDDTSDDQGVWRIVNLRRDDLFIELIHDTRDAPKNRAQGIAKVGFQVPDVRQVAGRVEQATSERPRVIDFSRHEIRLIQLRDPDGNIIQLSSRLTEDSTVKSLEDGGRELIDRAVRALGGEAHERVRSLRTVADCTHGDSQFSTEVISRRPDRTIFAQRAGDRAMELWVLGDEGFLLNPADGQRQPLTEPQRAMARGHEFHFLLFELDQRFKNPRLIGTEMAAGRACTTVAVEDETGRPASICFDESNELPLLLTYEPPGGAPGTIRMVLEEWRKIDGVQYLAAFTLHQGDDVFTYRYHTIEPNSVPEIRFEH